jgi:hypothetical protein
MPVANCASVFASAAMPELTTIFSPSVKAFASSVVT